MREQQMREKASISLPPVIFSADIATKIVTSLVDILATIDVVLTETDRAKLA